MIRENDRGGSRSLAMLWCQVGLHRMFELAGETSVGKLERQLISYNLLVSNTILAHQLLDQMSFIQRNNKHSRYLAYCAAVRSRNEEEARSCLNTITNRQGDMDQLLFACIGESVKHGKPLDTARLLQRLIDKHMQMPSAEVDVGVLLKYTAKTLLESVAGQRPNEQPNEEVLMRLCAVFKIAVRLQDKSTKSPYARPSAPQLDSVWFEEKSFEIARTHATVWPARYIIDLLDYSNQLCCHNSRAPIEVAFSEEQRTRLRDSTFMQTILYASEARKDTASYSVEDLPQTSYDSRSKPKTSECRVVLHQKVFKNFTCFREQHSSQTMCSKEEQELMQSQLQTMVPLAFEALLFMNAHAYLMDETAFDEISVKQFLNTAKELEAPAATYALLADTVLAFASGDEEVCSRLNGLRIPAISAARPLGQIILALRQVQDYNIEQAARWVRCVAQLILEDIEKVMPNTKMEQSLTMLKSVVQQAMDLAKGNSGIDSAGDVDMSSGRTQSYPPEELEWLATKLFNMAVDLCAAGDRKLAQQWAARAVEVAELLDNGDGGLALLLCNRIGELFKDVQSCT